VLIPETDVGTLSSTTTQQDHTSVVLHEISHDQ